MFVNNLLYMKTTTNLTIHYKGEILWQYRIPVIDMTIKLGPSTNHITNLFTTELHAFKQQHNYAHS